MHLDRYPAFADTAHIRYEFLSTGPKGTIKKVVKFTEIEENVFNLGFGDWDEESQTIRDDIRTNNADRQKVLATVAATVLDFIVHHPEAVVFAIGTSPAKTRLYQMGINGIWHEVRQLLDIKGFRDGQWEDFGEDKNYHAFTVKARQNL